MSLTYLLPASDQKAFIEHYYQRLPYAKTAAAGRCLELGTWDSLTEVMQASGADLMVVRENRQYSGPPPRTPDEAQDLVAQGYTLLVRHAEQHHTGLSELALGLEADFAAPVNIHMYCTPGNQHGFSWHYDAEEVFIVQSVGTKEYFLRKNSVNPWPVEERLPRDMQYEREIMPLMKVLLAAGDWLYIPSGYWHYGAASELAISLSIGIAPRTGIDLYDAWRRQVLDSLIWRQRLPVLGRLGTLPDHERQCAIEKITIELLGDLKKLATEPSFIAQFAEEMRAGTRTDE